MDEHPLPALYETNVPMDGIEGNDKNNNAWKGLLHREQAGEVFPRVVFRGGGCKIYRIPYYNTTQPLWLHAHLLCNVGPHPCGPTIQLYCGNHNMVPHNIYHLLSLCSILNTTHWFTSVCAFVITGKIIYTFEVSLNIHKHGYLVLVVSQQRMLHSDGSNHQYILVS